MTQLHSILKGIEQRLERIEQALAIVPQGEIRGDFMSRLEDVTQRYQAKLAERAAVKTRR